MKMNRLQECISNSLCSTTPLINTSDCFPYRLCGGDRELRSLELGLTALLTLGPVWCKGFQRYRAADVLLLCRE